MGEIVRVGVTWLAALLALAASIFLIKAARARVGPSDGTHGVGRSWAAT